MVLTNVKTVEVILPHIGGNHDRLGLLSPNYGQRLQQQSEQITLHSVILINNPKFLNSTRHTETRKIEIPRFMVVEALSW